MMSRGKWSIGREFAYFHVVEEANLRTRLGDNIAIARRRKGLSQPELATAANTSKGQISDWEAGRNQPRLEALIAIAKALDVTIDSLIHGEEAFAEQLARRAVEHAEKKFAEELQRLDRRIDELAKQRG